MEILIIVLVLGFCGVLIAGAISGLIALRRIASLSWQVRELEWQLAELRRALAAAPRVGLARVATPAVMATATATESESESGTGTGTDMGPPPLVPLRPPPRAEPAPPSRSLEELIGTRWTTWLGAVAMVVAAALFLELAVDRGWVGPAARIAMATAFGLALLVAGDRYTRRAMRALGQGLLGAGVAILHVTYFAGFFYLSLYPQPVAFALLVAVTILGVVLAVRHDALPIAFLAVLGGLLAPVMVSTGNDARDALFAYLAVLDLGVLAVAFVKRWRALDVLAFSGTWLLFGGWFERHYGGDAAVPTLAWLALFYAIFLVLPFVHHLRRRVPMDVERFVAALGNAAAAFGYSQAILGEHQHRLGAVALVMAAAYLVLGALTRRRLPDDGRAIFGFVTLSAFFATLAVPLYLGLHGWIVAWACEGPVLLYLGFRYRYYPVRALGLGVIGLAFLRALGLYELDAVFGWSPFAPSAARMASVLMVPAALAVYAAMHVRFEAIADRRDRPLRVAAAIAAGLVALVLLQGELLIAWEAHAAVVTAPLWALGTAGYLGFARRGSHAAWATSMVTAVVAVLGAAMGYDDGAGGVLYANAMFASALTAVFAVFAVAGLARRRDPAPPHALTPVRSPRMAGLGVLALWLLLTVETHAYFEDAHAGAVAQPAVSIVWAIYAVALVAIGLRRGVRPLRVTGLALFALTAVKLIVLDLDRVDEVYRALAFLVVGLLLTAASYLYHRFGHRFAASAESASQVS